MPDKPSPSEPTPPDGQILIYHPRVFRGELSL